MKVRVVASILVIGLMGVTVGCVGGDKKEQPPAADTQATPAAKADASTAASAAGEIGVPECDNYMTKYRECIESKVPASVKDTVRQSLDQATSAWKQAAATPEGRATLAQACTAATEAAKASMQAYGCSF